LQRGQALTCRLLGKAGHRVLKDVTVVLVDAQLGARFLLRLKVLANPERAVGIDAPRELDPELVLFPDLAGIDLASVADRFAEPLAGGTQHWLPEAQPLGVVGLV
jgi:hypothetical protein